MKSELTNSNPLKLLDKFSGKGQQYGNKEVVNFGEEIGTYIDPVTKQRLSTTRGTIHYDTKGGAHIVPAKPDVN